MDGGRGVESGGGTGLVGKVEVSRMGCWGDWGEERGGY